MMIYNHGNFLKMMEQLKLILFLKCGDEGHLFILGVWYLPIVWEKLQKSWQNVYPSDSKHKVYPGLLRPSNQMNQTP